MVEVVPVADPARVFRCPCGVWLQLHGPLGLRPWLLAPAGVPLWLHCAECGADSSHELPKDPAICQPANPPTP